MASGAAVTRLKASDLGGLSVGTVDLLAKFRDVSNTLNVAEVDVGAVKDTWKQVRGGRLSGSLEVEVAGEALDVMTTVFLAGALLGFSHNLMGSSITGCGLITSKSNRSGGVDGAQTQTFTMTVVDST